MVSRALGRRVGRRVGWCVAALIGAAVLVPAWAQQNFKIRLRPVPIESSTAAATTGAGQATAALSGRQLTVRGDFAGLQGAATVAHLHLGSVMGVRGPSIADVTVPAATGGQFTATIALTEEQVQALRNGRIYLQIHSATAPDGNLWGWLVP